MFSWLWPVGGDGDVDEPEVTIGSLENRVVELPEVVNLEADSQAALAQYKLYLEMPQGDPAMRMEALRRSGDLSLQSGETENLNNPEYADGMVFHNDAILLYEQLLENYDDYEKADLVLYQLGRAYESAGETEKALAVLDRLAAEYPDSQYIDEAQFRRGEILFMKKDFYAAAAAYSVVIAIGPESDFYQQSLYKNGWGRV